MTATDTDFFKGVLADARLAGFSSSQSHSPAHLAALAAAPCLCCVGDGDKSTALMIIALIATGGFFTSLYYMAKSLKLAQDASDKLDYANLKIKELNCDIERLKVEERKNIRDNKPDDASAPSFEVIQKEDENAAFRNAIDLLRGVKRERRIAGLSQLALAAGSGIIVVAIAITFIISEINIVTLSTGCGGTVLLLGGLGIYIIKYIFIGGSHSKEVRAFRALEAQYS